MQDDKGLASIFVSYAEEDAATALVLAEALSHTRFRRWIAPKAVVLGDEWVDRIERGLVESTYMVLVWSRAAATSAWVGKEWRSFLTKLGKQRIEVLPVRIEPVELPLLLCEYQRVDWWQDRQRAVDALVSYFVREQNALLGLESVRAGNVFARATKREIRLVAALLFDDAMWSAFLRDIRVDPPVGGRADLYGKLSELMQNDVHAGHLADWLGAELPKEVAAALETLRQNGSRAL